MDATLNPYTPGAGSQPRALTGRDSEIEAFDVLLARLSRSLPERPIVLCGLRGMGKTVLMREMARRARAADWRVAFLEARHGTDLRDAFTAAALEQLAGLSIRERALTTFKRTMSVIHALRAVVTPEVQVDIDPGAMLTVGRSLEGDLGELLSRVGQTAREQGIGVAFFLDELQELDREAMAAICAAMHRVTQEELPVAFVGAGLPSLPGLLANAKSYAERLFAYPRIGPLDEQAAHDAITLPPGKVHGDDAPTLEENAVDRMVGFAEGYPALLQAVAKHAWNHAGDDRITLADARAAEAAAFEDLSNELFLARWQRATPRERDYLAAIATVGNGCSSADAAEIAGFASTTAAGPVRDQLIGKGLLWAPERGRVAFTIPLFERFIDERAQHELGVRAEA